MRTELSIRIHVCSLILRDRTYTHCKLIFANEQADTTRRAQQNNLLTDVCVCVCVWVKAKSCTQNYSKKTSANISRIISFTERKRLLTLLSLTALNFSNLFIYLKK